MRQGLLISFSVLATAAGVIFALQGLGYLTGSVMTGTTLWAVLAADRCHRPVHDRVGLRARR
jgi:hypothetical protein